MFWEQLVFVALSLDTLPKGLYYVQIYASVDLVIYLFGAIKMECDKRRAGCLAIVCEDSQILHGSISILRLRSGYFDALFRNRDMNGIIEVAFTCVKYESCTHMSCRGNRWSWWTTRWRRCGWGWRLSTPADRRVHHHPRQRNTRLAYLDSKQGSRRRGGQGWGPATKLFLV